MSKEGNDGNYHFSMHERRPERQTRTERTTNPHVYEKNHPRRSLESFVSHEVNETMAIRNATSFNGIPKQQLERTMRPGTHSDMGFLGWNESLTQILAEDNDMVVGMDLTHQQLGDFLRQFADAPGEMYHSQPHYGFIEDDYGRHYAHVATQWADTIESPFADGTATNKDHTIIDLQTGADLSFSGLMADMIHGWGFYEGKETMYRLDPRDIAKVAGFIPFPPDDPIVRLVQERDAAVSITTKEQMRRGSNLNDVGIDIFNGKHVRIMPDNLDTLMWMCSEFADPHDTSPQEVQEQHRHIAAHTSIEKIAPQPYQMDGYDYLDLTDTVPSSFPELQQSVLASIAEVRLARKEDGTLDQFAIREFLQKTLTRIVTKVDGKDHPHKTYYQGLLKKIADDPQTTIALYEAAKTFRTKPKLLTAMEKNIPELNTHIIELCSQGGLILAEGTPLKQLLKDHVRIERALLNKK